MEFIRILEDEEKKEIASFSLKRALKVIEREKGFSGVGDTLCEFKEKPIQDGLYRVMRADKKEAFYIVRKILDDKLAFCYSIY